MAIPKTDGPVPDERVPEERRKEIFRALVEVQDEGVSVPQSRQEIADRFGLTPGEVWRIEREGLDNDWPPL